MSNKLLVFVGILIILYALTNCNSSQNVTNQEVVQKTSNKISTVNSPEENYAIFCADCHGRKLEEFIERKWTNGESKMDVIKSIKYGIVSEGMPAYEKSFSQQEIEELAAFILLKSKDKKVEQTPILSSKIYKTNAYNLQTEKVVDNIEIPWGIKVTEDGTIYFTERKGTLKIKKTDGRIVQVKNVPQVRNRGQGGMLDVTLHPDFKNNQWIYLSYSKKNPNGNGATTAVIRAKLVGDELKEITEIFEALPYNGKSHHYGSRMVFDDEGYLYISVGDRGVRDQNPQSLTNSCGKIHRVHDDGSIPKDNPFYGKNNMVASIWTYGNRNPQGLVFDEETKTVWEHEHGPKGGDELNLVKKGVNYGWPIASYGINYIGTKFTDITEREDFQSPVAYWVPSIAPSGMAIIKGENYPKWNGDILTGSLKFDYISRIKVDGNKKVEEELIFNDIGRVRSIEMGADGFLYIGVEDPGRILKVWVK